MFENLTDKITNVFNKLKGKGIIDENSLNEALREIRIALLASDVSIKVAKDFIERVKQKALGNVPRAFQIVLELDAMKAENSSPLRESWRCHHLCEQ